MKACQLRQLGHLRTKKIKNRSRSYLLVKFYLLESLKSTLGLIDFRF